MVEEKVLGEKKKQKTWRTNPCNNKEMYLKKTLNQVECFMVYDVN